MPREYGGMDEAALDRARSRERQQRAAGERRQARPGGRIGASERRMRALMVVPPKLKLSSQQGASMMLISATSVSPQELEAGLAAMRAARDNLRGERAELVAALVAMGFELRQEGV